MTEFFGARLQYVDLANMWLYSTYGRLNWLRGCSRVNHLPGYDSTANVGPLLIKNSTGVTGLIRWIVENGSKGWSMDMIQTGYTFRYEFFFKEEADFALARLTA